MSASAKCLHSLCAWFSAVSQIWFLDLCTWLQKKNDLRLLLLVLHLFNGLFSWQPGQAGTRKVNDSGFNWIKRWWSGIGIIWTICKSFAPRCSQITMPVPHYSVFTGCIPLLPPNQHHQSTEGQNSLRLHVVNWLCAMLKVAVSHHWVHISIEQFVSCWELCGLYCLTGLSMKVQSPRSFLIIWMLVLCLTTKRLSECATITIRGLLSQFIACCRFAVMWRNSRYYRQLVWIKWLNCCCYLIHNEESVFPKYIS